MTATHTPQHLPKNIRNFKTTHETTERFAYKFNTFEFIVKERFSNLVCNEGSDPDRVFSRIQDRKMSFLVDSDPKFCTHLSDVNSENVGQAVAVVHTPREDTVSYSPGIKRGQIVHNAAQ